MSTLLLRLAAPLQSWGMDSKFDNRMSGQEPSKSGVIGLLAAALGRRRDEPLDDLAALRFGVRVDAPGVLLVDFQMTHRDILEISNKKSAEGKTVNEEGATLSHRYYLSDAVFLVGLESDDEMLLAKLDAALRAPAFPLFLGRRSCPVTLPLSLGLRQTDLLCALREEKWQVEAFRQKKLDRSLRIVTDLDARGQLSRRVRDLPISFSPIHRRFSVRIISEHQPLMLPDDEKAAQSTSHDAFNELEEH